MIASRGGHSIPYHFHGAGMWSMQALLKGLVNGTESEMFTAAKFAAELWLSLGHRVQRNDSLPDLALAPAHAPLEANDRLLLGQMRHGVHAVMWTFVTAQMEIPGSRYAKATSELWTLSDTLCAEAGALDFSAVAFCAHGIGHTLTWYVSSKRNSISEALSVCVDMSPLQYQLSYQCQLGFFHEFERAALWRDRSLGQRFAPLGEHAPCAHNVSGTAVACFIILTANYDGTLQHRGTPFFWLEPKTVGNRTVVGLSRSGRQDWTNTLSFCSGDPYPGYVGEQVGACVSAFVWWLMGAVEKSPIYIHEADDGLVDAGSFRTSKHVLKSRQSGQAGQTSIRAPRLLKNSMITAGSPLSNSDQHELTNVRDGLKMVLCESATAGLLDEYWAWASCVNYVWGAGQFPIFLDVQYTSTDMSNKQDPWDPIGDGEFEAANVERCHDLFSRSQYEAGTERQLAFAETLCVDIAKSHGASPHPLLAWEEMPSLYAAMEVGPGAQSDEHQSASVKGGAPTRKGLPTNSAPSPHFGLASTSRTTAGLVTKSITAKSVNDSIYGPTINVTANPFFDSEGHVVVSIPPDELMAELKEAGCALAWRNRWHQAQELDELCDAIIDPFLTSSPGSALGLYATIVSTGLIGRWDGYFGLRNQETDPIMMLSSLMRQETDGSVSPDLSSLGWTTEAPVTLAPMANMNLSALVRDHEKGSVIYQYLIHAAGVWTHRYLSANSDELLKDTNLTTAEERELHIVRYGIQLWVFLGEERTCPGCSYETYMGVSDTPMDQWTPKMAALGHQLGIEGAT